MPLVVVSPSGVSSAASLALNLVREVSRRNKELILVTPSSNGTATQLVCTALNQLLPVNIGAFYAHVYGTLTGVGAVDLGNGGQERDASTWTAASSMVTLPPPGFPAPLASGVYEIRRLNTRERTLEAINSAIGQLGLYCLREFKDESLVGVNNTWRYTLAASQNWARVTRLEIQTNTTQLDYPYTPAESMGLHWRPERTTDQLGNELWQIQFESQPPPGYIIRVWGDGWYSDLVAETDVLAIAGRWQRIVLEWVYEWAQGKLAEWNWDAFPTGDAKKEHERKVEHLQEAKQSILEQMKQTRPGRIITPLNAVNGRRDDPAYLGAFTSSGFSRSPFRNF